MGRREATPYTAVRECREQVFRVTPHGEASGILFHVTPAHPARRRRKAPAPPYRTAQVCFFGERAPLLCVRARKSGVCGAI